MRHTQQNMLCVPHLFGIGFGHLKKLSISSAQNPIF